MLPQFVKKGKRIGFTDSELKRENNNNLNSVEFHAGLVSEMTSVLKTLRAELILRYIMHILNGGTSELQAVKSNAL